jgi:hypothetical protein
MKYLFFLIIIAVSFGQITGCTKDPPYPGAGMNTLPTNTAPTANAGEDLFVWPPVNEVTLNGSYLDPENNVQYVGWTMISGPSSVKFSNQASLSTKVSDLEAGVYQFELSVTDDWNLFVNDTVFVFVGALANSTEIIFRDLKWITRWYNNVEIKNFASNGTPTGLFKVFFQRDNDPAWKEVLSADNPSLPQNAVYDYFVIATPSSIYNTGSLYISYYKNDISDTPNVKIVF